MGNQMVATYMQYDFYSPDPLKNVTVKGTYFTRIYDIYNYVTITYDEQGNPIFNYNNEVYQWEYSAQYPRYLHIGIKR